MKANAREAVSLIPLESLRLMFGPCSESAPIALVRKIEGAEYILTGALRIDPLARKKTAQKRKSSI